MADQLKIAIATADGPEGWYFVTRLLREFCNVVCIVLEQKNQRRQPETVRENILSRLLARLREEGLYDVLYEHLIMRDEQKRIDKVNRDFFSTDKIAGIDTSVPLVKVNQINDSEVVTLIERLNPDILVVQGTSIIKKPLLTMFPRGIINIHGGLPKYRGTWPMFWALHNEDFKYLNSAIHFIDPGIDTGDLIMKRDLDLAPDDDHYSLRAKYLVEGAGMIVEALKLMMRGEVLPRISQPEVDGARTYYAKEATRKKRIELHIRIRKGLLVNYLKRRRALEK